MTEILRGQPNQQEIAGLIPDSSATQNVDLPTVARDKQGRIIWTVKGGTPEDNLNLGINNIQALVIAEVPELSSFPRDDDGKIREEDREQVESLILEQLKRNKTLTKAITLNNKISYPERYQYFRRSTIYTLATSFEEYGLFEDKVQKSLENLLERNRRREVTRNKPGQEAPPTIRLVDNKSNTESLILPLSQKAGNEKLTNLIKGKLTIDDIQPIYITDIRKHGDPGGIIYIGSGLNINLNAASYKSYDTYGALILRPQKNEEFGYEWLDVYQVEEGNTVNLNNKLDSIRFNKETNKLENKGWYGPKQQAFLDYISGILKIEDPSELPPFIAKIDENEKGIYLGMYQKKIYTVKFNQPLHTSSQEVLIKTKYDPERRYEWIEGYDIADKECSKSLFTKRIIDVDTKTEEDQQENKKGKQLVAWKGPQIQSIIDWVYDKLPTESTQEAKVFIDKQRTTDKDKKHATLYLDSGNLIIHMTKSRKLDRNQPVYLITKESGPYKWVEVQQDSNDNNDNLNNNTSSARQTITLARLTFSDGKPKLSSDWRGEEKQAIVDYIDRKIDPKYLKGLKLQVKKRGTDLRVDIVSFKDKPLRINLETGLFSPGEIVQIVPKVVTNDSTKEENLILEVSHENDDIVLKRFIYNRSKQQFHVLHEQNEESNPISPDQANEWLRRLVGEEM